MTNETTLRLALDGLAVGCAALGWVAAKAHTRWSQGRAALTAQDGERARTVAAYGTTDLHAHGRRDKAVSRAAFENEAA